MLFLASSYCSSFMPPPHTQRVWLGESLTRSQADRSPPVFTSRVQQVNGSLYSPPQAKGRRFPMTRQTGYGRSRSRSTQPYRRILSEPTCRRANTRLRWSEARSTSPKPSRCRLVKRTQRSISDFAAGSTCPSAGGSPAKLIFTVLSRNCPT